MRERGYSATAPVTIDTAPTVPDGPAPASPARMRRPRIVVLGLHKEAEAWRREHGLSWRDVVHVSTASAAALRGLSGPFEVITLPSWEHASSRVRAEVEQSLAIAELPARSEVA